MSGPTISNEDVDIVNEIKNNKITKFVIRYHKPLMSFIMHQVKRLDVAEDLYQDTLIRIIRKIDLYTYSVSFSGWIFCLAKNICKDWRNTAYQRRYRLTLDLPVPDSDENFIDLLESLVDNPESLLIKRIQNESILKAIKSLPKDQLNIVLARIDGTDLVDFARQNNIPANTANTRYFRAVNKIKKELQR